jgi:hypothetical protein
MLAAMVRAFDRQGDDIAGPVSVFAKEVHSIIYTDQLTQVSTEIALA